MILTAVPKWVAEVCVAREIGQEVKAYKDKKDTVFKLRKKRAEAKMYYKVQQAVGPRRSVPLDRE